MKMHAPAYGLHPGRIPWIRTGLLALGVIVTADPVRALPAGRVWATTQAVAHPSVSDVRAARLEVDSAGIPVLIIGARKEAAGELEWAAFSWRDSLWSPFVYTGLRQSFFPEPVLSLTPEQYLVWISTVEYPNGYLPLLFARLLPEPTPAETVLATLAQSSEYGGAVSLQRRWVVRSQSRYPIDPFTNAILVSYSDTVNIWRQLPEIGVDEFMCTIAPLSNKRAMVAYSDGTGLNWAIADGDHWAESGNIDPVPGGPLHPRFRLRPGGGLWLLWTDRYWVHVSSYQNGEWSRGDSTRAVHALGETYWSFWCDASRDTAERPVLAWGDLGFGSTFTDVGSVAFPTESGWAPGDEIPGSRGLFLTPKVTRDRNGDAWLMWDMRGLPITRFTHTYVSATTSTPRVAGAGRRRVVSWTLSEPAPESWWAVLRARVSGTFEQVARVRAGAALDMSWADESAPGGIVRYRIRRESVDARYVWESDPAQWPGNIRRPIIIRPPAMPVPARGPIEFAIQGAEPGTLEVRLYDLQGRLAVSEQSVVGAGVWESVRLGLGGAAPSTVRGVYFLKVRDAAGRESEALKVIILE